MKRKIVFIKTWFTIYLKYFFNKSSDIKICITSAKGYADKTIQPLIKQLLKCGVDYKNIYVFEAGYENYERKNELYNHFIVDHNSFDLTSLISILELNIESDYWLLLHDTLELHPSFKYIFKTIDPINLDVMPLKNYPSMNIGVYSMNYIKKNAEYIMSVKNKDYSKDGIQKSKFRGIVEEDYLFKNTENKKNINSALLSFRKSEFVQYHNDMRKKIFYTNLGIIKYQANYTMHQGEYSVEI